MKKTIALVLLGLYTVTAAAICPSRPTTERFTYSSNGAEVTDLRTGLVWARCSVGQTWSGSACTNSASAFTHEGALQYAATQPGWRLPSGRELVTLADHGCANPAIDSTAFPNMQVGDMMFWTSASYLSQPRYVWVVDFRKGEVYGDYRSNSTDFRVRLVRASQ
jgi:Protein of unknown function (DUF1566)